MIASPLKYHGGKTYLADWIISHFPPHTHYVEPYAGGLSVLLRKDPEGVSEVVNDLDGELINFWWVLRDDGIALQSYLSLTPFARKEWVDAEYEAGLDEVERAARFFIRSRQSRQGLANCFATLSKTRTRRGMNEQVSSWLGAIEGLPDIHDRLKRVVIENDDALAVIKREDSPQTLFYCDPPYVHETRRSPDAYKYEMTDDDHCKLIDTLAAAQGYVVLSGYPNPMYDDRLHGWRTVDRVIDKKSSSAKTKPKATERLWMNYD